MVITLSPISAPFEGRGHGEQRTRIAVGTSMALEFLLHFFPNTVINLETGNMAMPGSNKHG